MTSVKKDAIHLSIMGFKQMFDSEELSTFLKDMYDGNLSSKRTTYFAVKTPNGITKQTTIFNKLLQGDVLDPLVSCNMVDKYIGLQAMNSHNVYMYKNKIIIPPLTIQDDTLGTSKFGYGSQK